MIPYKRIAVKVGSNVLTRSDGTLDVTRLSSLVDQFSEIKKAGIEVILISSGAVASGRGELRLEQQRLTHLNEVEQRQLFSAVGQTKLINRYYDLFREHHIICGQVLCVKDNFLTTEERENMLSCIKVMLSNGVIPVVNENDVVSITELMFTDNDELAGQISRMAEVDALFILSNIDGLYNGVPGEEGVSVIPVVTPDSDIDECIQKGKSVSGRGGMQSKCATARIVAESGIDVFLARGTRENVLVDLVFSPEKVIHTHFLPYGK